MMEIPLRVDFAGGWLDVPKYAREGAFIVNCAITPKVSLDNWPYEKGSGLGGSAAYAILKGEEPFKSEADLGVGWQDPAIILETGLCAWRSGDKPVLDRRVNPDFLKGRMALHWTGKSHNNVNNVDKHRDFNAIEKAGHLANSAVRNCSLSFLSEAVATSYMAQLDEGMESLPHYGEIAKKYCGGGHGGYALYLFDGERPGYLTSIEPYMK